MTEMELTPTCDKCAKLSQVAKPEFLPVLPELQVAIDRGKVDGDVGLDGDTPADPQYVDLECGRPPGKPAIREIPHPLRRAITYSGDKISYVDILAPHGRRKRAVGGILSVCAITLIIAYTLAKLIYLFTDPQLTISSAVLETGNQPLPMCVGCRVLMLDVDHATCTVMTADGTLLPMTRVILPGGDVIVNQSCVSQWVNYHACTIINGRQPFASLIFVAMYVHRNWTFALQPEMVLVPEVDATITTVTPQFQPFGYT